MKLNPYLSFNGDCRAAFTFYQKLLGGQLTLLSYADTPMCEQTPAEQRNAIAHARLEIDDQVLMGGDAPPQFFSKSEGICVTLNVEQAVEAERLFAALSEGGNSSMPLQETFWAQRFGICTDRHGTPWMINCEKPR